MQDIKTLASGTFADAGPLSWQRASSSPGASMDHSEFCRSSSRVFFCALPVPHHPEGMRVWVSEGYHLSLWLMGEVQMRSEGL